MDIKKYLEDNRYNIEYAIGSKIKFTIYFKVRHWECIRMFVSNFRYFELKTSDLENEPYIVSFGRNAFPKEFLDIGMALMIVKNIPVQKLLINYFKDFPEIDDYEKLAMDKNESMLLYYNKKNQNC